MVNYFIYAKDFSGSTQYSEHFHSNGMKSFEQFKNDVEKIKTEMITAGEPVTESRIIYLHWGDECYEVDEDVTKVAYSLLEGGNMGTQPETIIEWIKLHYDICDDNNKIKLLYIITDGMIDDNSAEKTFALNENMCYDTVVFHAFNEDVDQIDLSVAASFFKSRCMVYRNYELFDNIDISQAFDYSKINISNFAVEIENLKSYIRLKFIKNVKHDAHSLQEIDKLKKLRSRLFEELASRLEKQEMNLETMNKSLFLQRFLNTDWYRNLIVPNQEIKVQIEKCISTLINYIINDKKSFSFDALKFETNYSQYIEEEPITDIDLNFTTEQEIEFPDIILDDDKGVPVIILTKFNLLDKIIFRRTLSSAEVSPASFNKFKSAMECPLFLLNDADISESIGYFYTLNVYKQLLEKTDRTEPRTRRPYHGGLVLTDTDKFDKYNDYILSATYFDLKKIKLNVGLFYFVLWKNCENKEWMDKNVVEQFKNYTMRRIDNTVCKIGLSSLPLDPQENTSLLTALWYCVELSSSIFKNNPQHFMHERLRLFHGVAHSMVEILKYFKYDLDIESIEKRTDLIRHVMILKRIPVYRDKVYYLLEKIFKKSNGFLVNEIEKPCNLYKLNYLKISDHKGMLRDDIIEEKIHLNNYVHLMHFVDGENGKNTFNICEKTYRPFFAIEQNKSFYTELVEITKRVVINNDDDKDKINITNEVIDSLEFDKILSLYNLFIHCVSDSEKYPSLPEFVEYVAKNKRYKNNLVTIFPSNVYLDIEDVYASYQNIATKVDVKKFIKVTKAYVKRSDRIKAEKVFKYSNQIEIDKFITSQELKVNLKKKL